MPAYERYCDLHITKATSYDFPAEILTYCQYQIEHQKKCVVGKKALIVLDFMDNWEGTTFKLLDHFKNGEVIFQGGPGVLSENLPR